MTTKTGRIYDEITEARTDGVARNKEEKSIKKSGGLGRDCRDYNNNNNDCEVKWIN